MCSVNSVNKADIICVITELEQRRDLHQQSERRTLLARRPPAGALHPRAFPQQRNQPRQLSQFAVDYVLPGAFVLVEDILLKTVFFLRDNFTEPVFSLRDHFTVRFLFR